MIQEDRLYRAVVDALAEDRLVLPTLPEVAMRVGQICGDPNASASRIAVEVSRDPAIAVRLLRVANSSALRGAKRIDSVPQAVARLGLGLLRSLVTGLALEQLFIAKSPSLRERLRRSWTHSLEVAALAQVLASHCTMLRPELAMLGGLVHEIGSLPVLRMAESLSDPPPEAKAVDAVMRKLQPRVGPMILKAWNFPEELIDVPAMWMDFGRSHDGPPDYVDVVTVAALQSHEGRSGRFAAIDRSRTPAFLKLDLSPEVDVFELEGVQESYEQNLAAIAA